MKRPSSRYRKAVSNFIEYEENIIRSERAWIYHGEDVVAVSPQAEQNKLNKIVEDGLNAISRKLLLVSPNQSLCFAPCTLWESKLPRFVRCHISDLAFLAAQSGC